MWTSLCFRLNRETITSGDNVKVLDFIYDESGKPFALTYTNGSASSVTYYYVLNLQGDVVGLLNSSGNLIARYAYTAWGEIISVTNATGTAITSNTHIANLNPLRYRGYYYDTQTGFYYLQSRYYDPVTHRFINADSIASTGQGFVGTNMFAYCLNNPIVLRDSNGQEPVETIDLDGDGEIDCYVYEYSYTEYRMVSTGIGLYRAYLPVELSQGYVCFFIGLDEEDFDKGVDLPDKYADSVWIGDARNNPENPNMQVYNSYKITSEYDARGIVDAMLQYDKEYPGERPWGRTKDSLMFEWWIHNMGYKHFNYGPARSTDFDYLEEGFTLFDYYRKYINNREKVK